MTRRARRTTVVTVATLALVAPAWVAGPTVLGRLAFFRVRQVELMGIRNLDPDAVLAALRLPARASVFADTRLLSDRVKGIGGVADARVVRRLPGVLRVMVRETDPVAFVPGPRGLVAVDGEGRTLPFDPARSGGELDLPVAAAADSGVMGVLARIQAVDPALFQDITAARPIGQGGRGGRGDVLVELGSRRVLFGRDAGPEVIEAVVLVSRDLAAKARPYTELDARYAGQVVVRRRPRA